MITKLWESSISIYKLWNLVDFRDSSTLWYVWSYLWIIEMILQTPSSFHKFFYRNFYQFKSGFSSLKPQQRWEKLFLWWLIFWTSNFGKKKPNCSLYELIFSLKAVLIVKTSCEQFRCSQVCRGTKSKLRKVIACVEPGLTTQNGRGLLCPMSFPSLGCVTACLDDILSHACSLQRAHNLWPGDLPHGDIDSCPVGSAAHDGTWKVCADLPRGLRQNNSDETSPNLFVCACDGLYPYRFPLVLLAVSGESTTQSQHPLNYAAVSVL